MASVIRRMIFQGYDGNSWEQMAEIGVYADSVVNDQQLGSRMVFTTRSGTGANPVEAMRITKMDLLE
ncbi:MAG: hypothetical protein IPI23_16595 [Bacteroidetes bacterium]|nr:hypothetical protein [Bacteroidota bacterium]